MSKRTQIVQILSEILAKKGGQEVLFTAQVVSVQGDTCTIDVDGLEVTGVRLAPTTTERDDVILLTPKKGGFVLVGSLSGDLNNLCVLAADALASLKITIGEISLFADKEGVILNDGKLGGLVKLKNVTEKINGLEKDINSLKNVLKAWTPVREDGGAALKTAVSSWAGQSIALTKTDDLENVKVKQ